MVKTAAGTNGLDIQRDYICVAQYSPQDMVVRQIAVQPLSHSGPGDFWDAVSSELSMLRKKVKFAGADVVCSVPCDMAVVRTLEAESDERDQHEVLRFELGVGLLGGIGEYAYDFYEVDPGNTADLRRYLGAALRKETLNKLRKVVRGAKLNPYIVDVDIFALTNVFQANYRDQFTGAAVLVLGEHRRTKLILVSNTSYIDYGVAEYDVDEHGAGGYADALAAEVNRLITGNASFLQGSSAPVYLAGGLFADSTITSKVFSGVSRSEMLNPFRKIQCAAGMDAAQLEANSCRLAVSVGLALRGEEGQ
jgi:Tfp pilus assembly PilM family ATPase